MKFQIGKAGVTEGTITSLTLAFKTPPVVRVSILQSLAPTKETVRAIAGSLVQRLGGTFKYSTVGFTIILKKRKKPST